MWRCNQCGSEVEGNFLTCWNCGYGQDGLPSENQEGFEAAKRDIQDQPDETENGPRIRQSTKRILTRALLRSIPAGIERNKARVNIRLVLWRMRGPFSVSSG